MYDINYDDEYEYDYSGAHVERKIKRDQYLKVWGFMITDLGLEKTELLVYAVIFSYYINYCDYYSGSRRYLQQWCNCSKTTVDNALKSLEKKNLIEKEYQQYGQLHKAKYTINIEVLPECEMFSIENRRTRALKKIREREAAEANA